MLDVPWSAYIDFQILQVFYNKNIKLLMKFSFSTNIWRMCVFRTFSTPSFKFANHVSSEGWICDISWYLKPKLRYINKFR